MKIRNDHVASKGSQSILFPSPSMHKLEKTPSQLIKSPSKQTIVNSQMPPKIGTSRNNQKVNSI